MTYPTLRQVGDPPPAGKCKLRIRSNGDPQETFVYAVDEHGTERELIGVIAAEWSLESLIECPTATIIVYETDVEIDVDLGKVKPSLPERQRERIEALKAALNRPVKP